MSHYSQQAQALVLRLPEHLEEGVRQRLRDGSLDGMQLTARPDGVEGLRELLVYGLRVSVYRCCHGGGGVECVVGWCVDISVDRCVHASIQATAHHTTPRHKKWDSGLRVEARGAGSAG